MYRVSDTTNSTPCSPTDTCKKSIDIIIQQLTTAATPGPNDDWKPITEVWDALVQMKSIIGSMTRKQKNNIESALSGALKKATCRDLDARLLKDVIADAILAPGGGVPIEQFLADKAYEFLRLPDLELLEKGEVEPNYRTFNSVLPSFAASTYDYSELGRTLLWKGACQLFAGPGIETRRDKLQQAIFKLPNPPKPGKEELKNMWDFAKAVDELGLDELGPDQPVDVMQYQPLPADQDAPAS